MSENQIQCCYVKFPSAAPFGSSIKPTKAGKIEGCWCWRARKRAECAGVALCQKYRKMREAEACDWDEILFPTITHSHILTVKHTHSFSTFDLNTPESLNFLLSNVILPLLVSRKKCNYPPNIWKCTRFQIEVMDNISINLYNFLA